MNHETPTIFFLIWDPLSKLGVTVEVRNFDGIYLTVIVTLENSNRQGRVDAGSKGCAAMANGAVKMDAKGGAQRTWHTGTWVLRSDTQISKSVAQNM